MSPPARSSAPCSGSVVTTATVAPRRAEMSTTLEPHSRVRFDDLTIVADGDSFIAGSTAQRTFIRVPAIGALVLEELAAGRSIAETERAAAENEPDGVDVM